MKAELDDIPGVTHLTIRDLLVPLFRHRLAVVLTFVSVCAASALAVIVLPERYESGMTILIKRGRVDAIISPDANRPGQRSDVTEDEVNNEVELIRSRDVLERVVRSNPLLTTDAATADASGDATIGRAITTVARNLRVTPLRQTNLIRVTYQSPDPRMAATVLTALSQFYIEKHQAVHRPAGAAEFFTAQAERLRTAVQRAQDRLTEFRTEHRVVSAAAEKQNLLARLAEFDAARQQASAALGEASRRIATLEAEAAATPSRHTTQIRTSDNASVVADLKGRIMSMELKRSELLQKFTPTYQPVLDLEEQLKQAQAALAAAEQAPLRDETTDQNPTYQWIEHELARVRADRAALVQRSVSLAQTIAEYRDHAEKLDAEELLQNDLLRDLRSAEESYLLYQNKREEARISDELDAKRIANIAIADPPSVPDRPVMDRRLVLAIGVAIAAVIALGVAFLLDFFKAAVSTPEDARRVLGVPVLASLPADWDRRATSV